MGNIGEFRVLLLVFAGFFLFFPYLAHAAQQGRVEPTCFQVRNTADYMVMGSFVTNYYADPAGVQARHRSDFRLEAAGTRDKEGHYSDRAEFCTYGPFFPGRALELVLRTFLFPIFNCNTRIDAGEILITGTRTADGAIKTEAVCL